MQKKTENKIRMFQAVWQVLMKFISIWAGNAGFKEVADEYKENLDAIDVARSAADLPTNGITTDKDVMYEDLVISVIELSGPFGTMANRLGDKELRAKVYFTESSLRSLPENELVQKAKDMAQLALQHKEGLAKYNITEAHITAMNDLAVKYENKIPVGRQTTAVRVSANIGLNQLVRKTSQLLKEDMNGLVNHYRRSNPDFWHAYFSARKIVDYGTRYEKPEEGQTGGTTQS